MPIPPEAHIRQIVSGVAEPNRRHRQIMMLTTYIDDSDMGGTSPVAVLGGFIAPADSWAAFSDDWKRKVLDVPPPPVRVFKPNASSWRKAAAAARLKAALGVIERHRPMGVVFTMPHSDYAEARDRFADNRKFRSPYYVAFMMLAMNLSAYFRLVAPQYGMKVDKINFVFDDQPGQVEQISSSWRSMYDALPEEKRQLFHRNPPDFRDDSDVLPLQAAHMVAWNTRRVASDAASGADPFSFEWPETVKVLAFAADKSILRAV